MGRSKTGGSRISGWLVVDKPIGMTSTRVVGRVKWLTGARKVGHGGTLDPLAHGVLPVALGEATKTVAYVMDASKTYRFTVRFGEARDTDDAEGVVVATSDDRPSDASIVAALPVFHGTIWQRPPNYAAVKVRGERAYDLARRGEVVELEPREVRVDELRLCERADPDHASFTMTCGKGAYVRSVARDLGAMLGCHAHVVALERTSVGPFRLADAVPLDRLEQLVADETMPQVTVSIATALAGIPALAVTSPQALRLRSGQAVRVEPGLVEGGMCHASPDQAATVQVTQAGELVALARLDGAELSPVRVFNLHGGGPA